MAVTDLTGTKWYFNESFTTELATGSYFINFISNNTNFTGISADKYNSEQRLYYDNTLACSSEKREDYWKNEAFRTIEITGGTYVTHASLISWLQANATQIVEPTETNTFSFGDLPIANMYFGTRQVKKVYLGNTLVWEKEVTVIEFNIGSTTYQAEEGMTWGKWVDSSYNTDDYKVFGGQIYNQAETFYVTSVGGSVPPSSTIVANFNYGLAGGGGN